MIVFWVIPVTHKKRNYLLCLVNIYVKLYHIKPGHNPWSKLPSFDLSLQSVTAPSSCLCCGLSRSVLQFYAIMCNVRDICTATTHIACQCTWYSSHYLSRPERSKNLETGYKRNLNSLKMLFPEFILIVAIFLMIKKWYICCP